MHLAELVDALDLKIQLMQISAGSIPGSAYFWYDGMVDVLGLKN